MAENEQILQEQVKLLFSAIPLALVANVINGTLLVSVQWNVVNHTYLLVWLSLLIFITLGRALMAWSYRKEELGNLNCKIWEWNFNLGVVLAGAVWGASSFFIFPDELAHQAFHAFVIAGMSAGAVSTLSYRKFSILIFLFLCHIPVVLQLFLIGGQTGLSMGVMGLLFFLIVANGGLRIFKSTQTNIQLRIDAMRREKSLRESEERSRTIFESTPLGILHYNAAGDIEAYNEELAVMLGISMTQLRGNSLLEIISPRLRGVLSEDSRKQAVIYVGSGADLSSKNEIEVRIHLRSIEGLEQEMVGGVMVVEDISDDKRIERIKDEFIATVSHELRTPLTAIIGSLGLIRSGVLDAAPEKGKLLVDTAYRNSERLLMLINDILDVEKMDAGKMEYTLNEQPLCELLEQAIQSCSGYGQKHDITFNLTECDKSHIVRVDSNRMIQVMNNLLSNAAKFSPNGGHVDIKAERCESLVRVSVIDCGEGIPEEFRDKLFERFSQSDGSSVRRSGGTGLGLNIVRSIVEYHHGKVDYHSVEGKGTTFYFDLPLIISE